MHIFNPPFFLISPLRGKFLICTSLLPNSIKKLVARYSLVESMLRHSDYVTVCPQRICQFIAQILRCYILFKLQSTETGQLSKVQSVTDLLWNVTSLRRVHVEGHRPFYKRPTKTQREIFSLFGIPMNTTAWPSML